MANFLKNFFNKKKISTSRDAIGDFVNFLDVKIYIFTTAITANSTLTAAPVGSLALTIHATGKGQLFVSDATKWQNGALHASQAALVADLTNSSGGTVSNTIAAMAVTVTGVDGTGSNAASKADVDAQLAIIRNAIASLAAKSNADRAAFKTAGQMASS